MNVYKTVFVALEHSCPNCFGTQFSAKLRPINIFGTLLVLYCTEAIVFDGD